MGGSFNFNDLHDGEIAQAMQLIEDMTQDTRVFDQQPLTKSWKLEADLFAFLVRKYVQRQNARQAEMGLQYTNAETHDLAKEIADFIQPRH